MSPVYGLTNWTIKKAIARACGPTVFVGEGTMTSGSATTGVDTVNFTDATDSRLKGPNVYIGNGAGQGRETRSTAFTPVTDTITIPSGTALDSTSEYLLTRRFTNSDIVFAMRQVLQRKGPYAKSYVDQSLMAGNPLINPTFYDASGTIPNGWTKTGTGTFTIDTTVSKHGRKALKIVSTTTNAAGAYQDLLNIGGYRGKQVRLSCWVKTDTADRVTLTIDDGIDTTTGVVTITDANRGWGAQRLETPTLTVSNRMTRIRISLDIIAGGSTVTAYFSAPYPIGGPYCTEWNVPAGAPTSIHRIRAEEFEEDAGFGGLLTPHKDFGVTEESTKRLYLKTEDLHLGSIMSIHGRTGWTDMTAPTTDDDSTYEGDASGLIDAASQYLMAETPAEKQAILEGHSFTKHATAAPAGSVLIERQ